MRASPPATMCSWNWRRKARNAATWPMTSPPRSTANPAAAAFFDTLAQFYRKAYLRWIDGTTRRPDLRAARIAEVVDLLAAGVKQRPRHVSADQPDRRVDDAHRCAASPP